MAMIGRFATLVALVIAVIVAVPSFRQPPPSPIQVRGKNNTALFVVAEHHGLSNVHLATAQAMLEQYPHIQLHFASFPKLGVKFPRLSSIAREHQPRAKDIVFHPLTRGPSWVDAYMERRGGSHDEDGLDYSVAPKGLEGMNRLAKDLQGAIDPWDPDEHFSLYEEISQLIEDVDPAVVVLDTLFQPAIEATREKNRVHAFITPNTLVDNFLGDQPHGKMFWKYPAMASGFPYPVPWSLIPMNILLNMKLIYSTLHTPALSTKKAILREKGIDNPIQFIGLHRSYAPWITQTTQGASIPVDFVPENVTCTGPISVVHAPAREQDPELMDWVERKPTIYISLSSELSWSIQQTEAMVSAIETVLEKTDFQILWKYRAPKVPFNWEKIVESLEATGRVKVSSWLKVDPPALLQSGSIVTFVTHGGANSFHEAIEAGVPQVVLPLWADLYNFAALVESSGTGVWACRETSPTFLPECLSEAIIKVAGDGPESLEFATKAKTLGEAARATPGRNISARIVAQLATSGRSSLEM